MTSHSRILVLFFFSCCVLRLIVGQSLVTSLTLTNATTYADVVRDVTTIHKNYSTRFAKIESDRVSIYRDNYCYEGQHGDDDSDKRVGVCLRFSLNLTTPASGKNGTIYFFVTEDGIHYNDKSNGSYTRIDGQIRRVRWYEDFIEEQLELRNRVFLCGDGRPNEIRLDGKIKELASKYVLKACRTYCLAKSTLQKVSHVRLSPWWYSPVYCLGRVCASAYHVIKVNGESVTMDALCNRPDYQGKCSQRVEHVAKAILQTQRVGDIDVTFVAAQSNEIRTILLGLQLLIDHLRVIFSLVLCAALYRAHGKNKHRSMLSRPVHSLCITHWKEQ